MSCVLVIMSCVLVNKQRAKHQRQSMFRGEKVSEGMWSSRWAPSCLEDFILAPSHLNCTSFLQHAWSPTGRPTVSSILLHPWSPAKHPIVRNITQEKWWQKLGKGCIQISCPMQASLAICLTGSHPVSLCHSPVLPTQAVLALYRQFLF